MGIKFNKVEKVEERKEGEYLFQIYEVNEKISQVGNPYLQIKFKTKDEFKVCDNFMFSGKAATKTLALFKAIGIGDGENWEDIDVEVDDILGNFLYINVKKDGDFFKCSFNASGYRPYEEELEPTPKKKATVKSPF